MGSAAIKVRSPGAVTATHFNAPSVTPPDAAAVARSANITIYNDVIVELNGDVKMPTQKEALEELTTSEYKAGFVTDIEMEFAPKGLSEDIVRFISQKKEEPDWLLEWRRQGARAWAT